MNRELQAKLLRARQRMGESGSPVKGDVEVEPASRATIDLEHEGRVRQRALGFQQVGMVPKIQGRLEQDGRPDQGKQDQDGVVGSNFCLGFWKDRETSSGPSVPMTTPRTMATPRTTAPTPRLPSQGLVEANACPVLAVAKESEAPPLAAEFPALSAEWLRSLPTPCRRGSATPVEAVSSWGMPTSALQAQAAPLDEADDEPSPAEGSEGSASVAEDAVVGFHACVAGSALQPVVVETFDMSSDVCESENMWAPTVAEIFDVSWGVCAEEVAEALVEEEASSTLVGEETAGPPEASSTACEDELAPEPSVAQAVIEPPTSGAEVRELDEGPREEEVLAGGALAVGAAEACAREGEQEVGVGSDEDEDDEDEVGALGTQVLRPLQDWLAVLTPRGTNLRPAAEYALAASEPPLGGDAESGLEQENSEAWVPEGCFDLFEYDILDYFDQLPEGILAKLRGSFQMYQEFVQDTVKKNEMLRAKLIRARETAASQMVAAEAASHRARGPEMSMARDEWRRELRREMSSRILLAQEARLRIAAEANEAAMRARLEYTKRVAHERIVSLTKNVEVQEEACRSRAIAARSERERVKRHLEAARREIEQATQQVSDMDKDIKAVDGRFRRDPERESTSRNEAKLVRNEGKAHKARVTKHKGTQQRVKDLARELEDTRLVLAQLGGA
mmetsp:Transcript_168176/g.540267  ORF Transcript_168176/g.540267 Transcript_168176/m.540267 type:complete len:678 (+) Transcript_168176:78-2111(+)